MIAYPFLPSPVSSSRPVWSSTRAPYIHRGLQFTSCQKYSLMPALRGIVLWLCFVGPYKIMSRIPSINPGLLFTGEFRIRLTRKSSNKYCRSLARCILTRYRQRIVRLHRAAEVYRMTRRKLQDTWVRARSHMISRYFWMIFEAAWAIPVARVRDKYEIAHE